MVLLQNPKLRFRSSELKKNYRENQLLQVWVVVIACMMTGLKFAAWWVTGSLGILTDLWESLVNIITAIVGLYSLYLSSKPSDHSHPYGHGKVEFISAALEGSMISIAGFSMIIKAASTLKNDHFELAGLSWGLLLIGVTGVVNLGLGTLAVRIGNKNRSSYLKASGKHLLSDTYTTAALFISLFTIYFTGLYWIDPLISILLSLILLVAGFKIVRNSIAGIMDEADEQLLTKLAEVLQTNRREAWVDTHNVRFIRYGGRLHLDCHLILPWYYQIRQGYQEVVQFNELVDDGFGELVEVFVHVDQCNNGLCQNCNFMTCPKRAFAFQQEVVWTPDHIAQNTHRQRRAGRRQRLVLT